MTGSSFFEYVHEADHAELTDQLGLSLTNTPTANGGNLASPSAFDETTTTGNGREGDELR